MNQTQVLEWQSPYVDLFKYYNVFDGSGHDKKGNIGIFQDTNIGRRVFRIQGSISAVNYVSFPPVKSTIQSLGCNGKYLYIEIFPQEFFFSIHFDFIIPKRNNVRFTLSNMYDAYKVTSSNTLQIPFPKDVRNRWCVVCIDIEKHMQNYGLFPSNAYENYSKIYILKAIQMCSTLSIRGIYTSDNLYTPATLPREMDFKMQKGKWEDFYRFLELPVEVTKNKPIEVRQTKSILKKSSKQEERSGSRGKSPKDKKKTESVKKGPAPEEIHPVQVTEKIPEKPPVKPEERSKIPWYRPPSKSASAYADQSNSLLSLEHVIGFSGRRCPDIKWSRNAENLQEILFASGNIVVAHDVTSNQQRFFTENTSPVCCLDISKDGTLVAVAQEDRDPCVKIYDYFSTRCLGTIPVKMNEIRSISISNNKAYLSVAGVDTYNRDFLTIWDLNSLGQKSIKLVAKQMSEFNILTCKFSPLNDDQLVSCGRENIRFWRIKSDHISGGAVVLTQHARDTVFTVLDFDFTDDASTKRVFVGTKHGLLFQVNYDTRKLEGLFKLHESCICSLSVSAGFCVTGSEDQYLRVWPLDFSEYFLEAKHEGIVISLDISYDSLHVVSGVSSGGLSIIDLSNQSCLTLMRTHTNRIKQINYHAFSNSFVTLSEDLSIKVWNADKRDQIYEFSYSKEDPCTAISTDPHGLFIAAGFNSGLLRVFDLERTKVGEEFKYHNTPLTCVLYSPNGKYLITADRQGSYNLFDVDRSFQPVKVFEAEIGNDNPTAAFTTDSETLATTGAYTNTINLWDLNRFFRRGRIIVKNSTVQNLKFSSDDHALFVLLHDGKIKMYGARHNEPVLIKDITPASKILSTSLDVAHSKGYLLTGCNDAKLRIWDIINDPSEDKYVFPQGGHTQAISAAIFSSDNQKVFSTGNDEGIYIWNFKGDLDVAFPDDDEFEGFSRMLPGRVQNALSVSKEDESVEVDKLGEEIFVRENEGEEEYKAEEHKSPTLSEVKKQLQAPGTPPGNMRHSIKDITNAPPRDSPSASRKEHGEEEMRSMKSEKTQGTHQLSHSPLESRTQMFLKQNKSGVSRKAYKFKKFVPNTRASTSPGKSPRKIEAPARKYIKSAFRENNKLPFKHYALEGDGRLAEQKSKSVFKARNKIELEYYIGYNNDAHNNIVWNIPGGWFAYGSENYVIIEQLNSQRSQKVITFPDFVSCLALSKDHTYLAVGTATYDTNIYANVHIIDCYTLKTTRTLKFHNKGIQTLAFSSDSRYLISAGNYRECTIAVWDPSTGQLIASSYTLTNINEIKVKNFPRSGILEFVSVGADQVIQWVLTDDSKLLNSESFIQPKNTKTVELTTFSFVLVNERDYILMGSAEGELMLFDLSTGELELRKKLCVEEIIDIHTNNNELKAVITSFDAKIYHWNYSEKLKFDEDSNLTNMELKYPATCTYLEETLNEGLLGTYDGGILYANFHEDLFSKLVGSPSVDNYVIRIKELDDTMFVTFHAFGSIKLWNSISGEELFDFAQPRITCKDVLLHKGRNEILCFYNDNTAKIVSLDNFEKVTPYIVDEFMIQPGEEPRYIHDSQAIQEQGSEKPYYLSVTNRGEIYVSDLREKDEINWTEVIEQGYVGNVAYFDAHAKQRVLNVCFDDGTIQTYSFFRGNQQFPDMSLQDQWNVMDDPHGDLDRNEEARLATMTIYGTKAYRVYKITTAFTEMRGVYFVITQYLQYAFLRNSLNKEILRRISLDSFPLSLTYEIATKNVVVGLDDGQIVYYDFEGNELFRQRNFNDGGVISLSVTKDEDTKKLLAIERKGMTIYKYA